MVGLATLVAAPQEVFIRRQAANECPPQDKTAEIPRSQEGRWSKHVVVWGVSNFLSGFLLYLVFIINLRFVRLEPMTVREGWHLAVEFLKKFSSGFAPQGKNLLANLLTLFLRCVKEILNQAIDVLDWLKGVKPYFMVAPDATFEYSSP